MHQPEPLVYIVDDDLSHLKRKLKKGSSVQARVVVRLNENKYVLRIFGYNLVMKSDLEFNQFDEVELVVNDVSPRFCMSVRSKSSSFKNGSGFRSKNMDFFA